jgi:hypothetical protein
MVAQLRRPGGAGIKIHSWLVMGGLCLAAVLAGAGSGAAGPYAGLTPAQVVQKLVADAAAYNNSRRGRGYGFAGDPLRPVPGKYYGYLIRAGGY